MSFWRNVTWGLRGANNYTKGAFEDKAKNFEAADMEVDRTGKLMIVTGANSGIGMETAMRMAERGATVFMLCRSRERGVEAQQQIIAETKNERVYLHVVDLSSSKQIRSFAEQFNKEVGALHVLVNCAGAMVNEFTTNDEGLEVNFAINTMGTFLLTSLLLPSLRKGAVMTRAPELVMESGEEAPAYEGNPEWPAEPSRVITVSSGGMLTEKLNLDDVNSEKMNPFDGTKAYARNKRQQVALTEVWQDRYGGDELIFNSCHPGWVDTPAVKNSMPDFYKYMKEKLRTPEQGADTVAWLALADVDKQEPASFYEDREPVDKHLLWSNTAYEQEDMDKLFQMCCEIANWDESQIESDTAELNPELPRITISTASTLQAQEAEGDM